MTMLSIPTKWPRNAMTIDKGENNGVTALHVLNRY